MNTNMQISSESIPVLIENMKKSLKRPAEWLRQYYSAVMEHEINDRQAWSLIEVQAAFFAGVMPADYSLLLRAACCLWFYLALKRCRRLFRTSD